MTASAQLNSRFPARDSEYEPGSTRLLLGATHARPRTAPPAPLLPVAPPMRAHAAPPAPRRCSGRGDALQTAVRTRTPRPKGIVRLTAAAVALVVVGGLGWLGQAPSAGVPAETAVIRVGAGETVWDVAQRVAPKSDQRAVVERIQQLNGIAGSAIQPGQELQVPDGR